MTTTDTPIVIGTIPAGAKGRVVKYGRGFTRWGRLSGWSDTHVLLENCDNGHLDWLENHAKVVWPKTRFTDADADQFHFAHNHKNGCQMGRTAGSATIECDTHGVTLTLDVPVILRDI